MMKKLLWIIPILLLVAGCGKAEKKGSITCTYSTNDVINGYKLEARYTLNYSGDYATSVDTEEIVTSENEDILKTFEDTLNQTYSATDNAYGGYDFKVTNENNKVVSKVTIDYTKMDIASLAKDQPSLASYIKNDRLTVEGVKSIYTTMGATCNE